ncbi:hypothetical protein NMY22_g14753 [Coprinellus aureogranulatus]|nr:hypothetical protein NMY22_g14753 [Coprinellus aureogranulatus]
MSFGSKPLSEDEYATESDNSERSVELARPGHDLNRRHRPVPRPPLRPPPRARPPARSNTSGRSSPPPILPLRISWKIPRGVDPREVFQPELKIAGIIEVEEETFVDRSHIYVDDTVFTLKLKFYIPPEGRRYLVHLTYSPVMTIASYYGLDTDLRCPDWVTHRKILPAPIFWMPKYEAIDAMLAFSKNEYNVALGPLIADWCESFKLRSFASIAHESIVDRNKYRAGADRNHKCAILKAINV